MPTEEQKQSVADRIDEVKRANPWNDLKHRERAAILQRDVRWDAFDAADRFDVIESVLDGRDRSRWLDGIATDEEKAAREDAIWDEAARGGNGSPNSEPYFRRDWIGFAEEAVDQLKRTDDFVRLDNGYVFSERLDRPEGDFQRLGTWNQLEERDKLAALAMSEAAQMFGGDDMRALLMREIDFTQVPRDAQRRWLGEVYADVPADLVRSRSTAMAASQDRQAQAEAVAAFEARIEQLRHEGVYVNDLRNTLPWAAATEADKLEAIVMAAQYASPDGASTVPGSVTLQAIEREVDEARLPEFTQEMLRALRANLADGHLDGPHPKHNMDRAWMALRDIVAASELELMVETITQEGGLWRPIPEDDKAGMIVNLGVAAGSPGTHTLAAIEREVDYDGLSPWRREALQGVRLRLDRGELDGESPDPVYRGDRVNTTLRLAEFEARVQDFKQIGVGDDEVTLRRWRDLSEGEKFDRIMDEVVGLYLGSESRAYEIIAREVDMTRAPEDPPRQFEGSRSESALGNPDRDDLIRETYRLNHELGYIGFRHQYFNDPDAIKEWPDPAIRERELRSFWDNEHEGRFASYPEDFAKDSVEVLTAYRDYLRGLLAGDRDGQVSYYKQVSEAGRGIRLHEGSFREGKAAEQALPSPGELAEDYRGGSDSLGPEPGHQPGRGR
jgi:hypothetical protein